MQFLFFSVPALPEAKQRVFLFCRVVFDRKWLRLNALYSYDDPDSGTTILLAAPSNVTLQSTQFQRLP